MMFGPARHSKAKVGDLARRLRGCAKFTQCLPCAAARGVGFVKLARLCRGYGDGMDSDVKERTAEHYTNMVAKSRAEWWSI